MSRGIKSLNEDKERMQTSLNISRRKNAKLFDEISVLSRDILTYKKRLERAYRPLEGVYRAPERAHKPLEDVYRAPERAYRARERAYRAPERSYSAPERAYRPRESSHETKPQHRVIDSYPVPATHEKHYRAPIYGLHDSYDSYSAPTYSEINDHASDYGYYGEDYRVKRGSSTADPVVQKTYRTQDGVLHRIYTVKSAV